MTSFKQFLYPLILSVLFFSCSTSDDNVASSEELIVGVWQPIESIRTVDGSTQSRDLSDCEQQSRYTFSKNGDLDIIEYSFNSIGDCESGSDYFESIEGKWKKLEGNKYEMEFTYYFPETGATETEEELVEITFQDEQTMQAKNIGGSEPVTMIFKRIN